MSAAPGKSPDCSSQSTSAPHPRARIAPPGKAIANCHAGAAQAWRCTFSRGRRLFGPLRSGPNNPSSSRNVYFLCRRKAPARPRGPELPFFLPSRVHRCVWNVRQAAPGVGPGAGRPKPEAASHKPDGRSPKLQFFDVLAVEEATMLQQAQRSISGAGPDSTPLRGYW